MQIKRIKQADAQRTGEQLAALMLKASDTVTALTGDDNPQVVAARLKAKTEYDLIARVLASLEGDRVELTI